MADSDIILQQQITEMRKDPEPEHVGPSSILVRRPLFAITNTSDVTAEQWRAVVSKAPIVRDCISTLILQLMAVPWEIISDDPKEVEYYTSILEHFGEENFSTGVGRIIQDTLEVPFGGAAEVVRYPEGILYNIFHVDAGTLIPTYDDDQPYAQVDPVFRHNKVFFAPGQLVRLPWRMQSSIHRYGWTFTPVMDCFVAMQSLIQTDIFYNTMLSDTPPPGILDLLDMRKEQAQAWISSFRATFEGIDAFKVPVLYDHKEKAEWIPFQESSTLKELPKIIRQYAEIVTAAFGMSIVDLGLYEYSQTKAGSVTQIQASKRQGFGSLMTKVAEMINSQVLPETAKFRWNPVDDEDVVHRATAQKLRVEAMKTAVETGFIREEDAQKMLVEEGIFIIDMDAMGKLRELPEAAELEEPNDDTVEAPIGEEEEVTQSLYEMVLDDDNHARYSWEECGRHIEQAGAKGPIEPLQEDPTAFDIKDKSFLAMRRLMEKISVRINGKLTPALIREAVNAVWNDFPEPEERVIRADTSAETVAKINAVLGKKANITKSEISSIDSIMTDAYSSGLLNATDDVWSAMKATNLAKGSHGLNFSVKNPRTLKLLRSNAIKLGGQLDQGTRSLVSRLIFVGVRNGKAVGGTRDSVSRTIHEALPNVIGKRRARSIALFEINKAQSQAHLDEYDAVGLKEKHWVRVPALACPICTRNDEKGFVSLSTDYESVFGPVNAPPAHPTVCYCHLQFNRKELKKLTTGKDAVSFWNGTDKVPVTLKR